MEGCGEVCENTSYVWTTSSFISQKTMTISGRSVTNYGSLDLTDISILTGLNDTLGMARTIVHILTIGRGAWC